jgi:hypothetical protein
MELWDISNPLLEWLRLLALAYHAVFPNAAQQILTPNHLKLCLDLVFGHLLSHNVLETIMVRACEKSREAHCP